MTPAEEAAWAVLQDRRFRGLKFRRQHPTGPFVLDFYCHELRLAIEIDGRVHESAVDRAADRERQRLIEHPEAGGLRFIRLAARAVELDPSGTIEAAVVAALGDPPRRRARAAGPPQSP